MSEVAGDGGAVPADELARQLRLALFRLFRHLRRREPSDLTIAQLSALATVVHSGPLSIGHLAEIEGLPSPAATRLADRLEDAGFVSRHTNPADRRGVHLVATVEASELLARRQQAVEGWLAEQLDNLGEADRLAMERAVAVLESFATQRPAQAPPPTTSNNDMKETRA